MNPIIISVFGINIHWYSVIILLGMLMGCFFVSKEAKKYNYPKLFMDDLFFYTLIFGLIGARLYYVIFEYNKYINTPLDILKVWEGGLAIHGGIIAGLLTIIYLCKKHKMNVLKITDMAVFGVIIGQAIGRWGNFFNGEAYGPSTTLSFLNNLHLPQFIIDGMNINGVYYQPTFLYESLWCILGLILLIILRKSNKLKLGQLTGIYLIWYSIGRFLIEGLRQDSLMLFGMLKQAQIISIILILVGLVLLIVAKKNKKYSEEKYNV